MKRCLIGCLAMLLPHSAAAADKYPRLPVGREKYTLNTFHPAMGKDYFGVYASPYSSTGVCLALFPDGRFAIFASLDIGPDRCQALGRYAVEGDRLKLAFTRVRLGRQALRQEFSGLHILWGWIEKKDYVTGFEVFVFKPAGWQQLGENPQEASYLQRRVAYYDWLAILHRHEKDLDPDRGRSQ